jgi:integrase
MVNRDSRTRTEAKMLTEYITHLKDLNRAPGTIKLRATHLRAYVTRHDPEHATPDSLSRWVHSQGWKPATVESAAASLRGFFHWAHETGRIATNPAAKLRPKISRRTVARIATDAQIAAGLKAASRPEHEAWLRLGAECGLRVHEIAKVHVDDIDGEWLTVLGKGGQYRTVWLSDNLRDALARCATTARHGHLFPGKSGQPVSPTTVWRAVRKLADVNTHALRHRAGTTVYRLTGNDLRVAQEFLGHSNPTTTARYVHVEQDQLRQAGMVAQMAA